MEKKVKRALESLIINCKMHSTSPTLCKECPFVGTGPVLCYFIEELSNTEMVVEILNRLTVFLTDRITGRLNEKKSPSKKD